MVGRTFLPGTKQKENLPKKIGPLFGSNQNKNPSKNFLKSRHHLEMGAVTIQDIKTTYFFQRKAYRLKLKVIPNF